jgi:predicted amidohydrolase
MRSEKGAIKENLVETACYIDEAERCGIDIIGLPEASISGYNDRAKHPEAVISLDGQEVASFLKLTEGKKLTVLAGIIESNPWNKPYTTQLIARDGKLVGYYRKINIVDDDNDWITAGDEIKVFNQNTTPGNEIKVFDHDVLKFGIAICSDISLEKIFGESARMGAKIVFELAAPGLYGEQATRNWEGGYRWWEGECLKLLPGYAKKYGIWIAVATQSGRTSDEDFPGGAYLFNPEGARVYSTKDWHPGVSYLEIDLDTQQVREI